MRFEKFLKEKIIYIALIIFFIVTAEILLLPFDIGLTIKIYIGVAPAIICLISIIAEYKTKKDFYDRLKSNMEGLNQKYLISEIIDEPNFIEGKILKETIQDAGKSMLENVNKYKYIQEDYKEYIELWIHEVKVPIAATNMIIENNKDDTTKSIKEELDKIENYIEQALYYARSNTVEKDYCIKKTKLDDVVKTSIIKNKTSLIQNHININLHDLDTDIYSDSKWTLFILNQIIQNSIKYSKPDNKEIEIWAEEEKNKTCMYIKDNGIGIAQKDQAMVFEKGFTGENGRLNGKKSTGIGLYLCKKLCDKMGLGIKLSSQKGEGTQIQITFPKNSFVDMKEK